jgi:leucyl aminopeptidase
MAAPFVVSDCFSNSPKKTTLPIYVVTLDEFKVWTDSAPDLTKKWLSKGTFRPKTGACCLLPSESGPSGVLVTVKDASNPWDFANLPQILQSGSLQADPELSREVANALCLGWALGSYRYENYKKKPSPRPTLVWPGSADRRALLALAEGICLCRDLVNCPASDMGPEELARAAKDVARRHGAKFHVTVGDALLKKNYPMIHAVGRASTRAPRLIDFTWGREKDPKLTLVGKGVCFDTGGLDLKPAQYMKLMKKDMGGAALVLGLAHAIMGRKLPIRLRVLIPAVENSVSGNAMRPLDVLASRKGISVEVGDTDAEGRLVLADALTEADGEAPDLLVDAATLTGAARVALGTGMPAIFSRRTQTWSDLENASESVLDPLWRLPLHQPYRSKLNSKVADISSIGSDAYGGAITAALFLSEFVSPERDWVHMDTMGYNLGSRPGRPPGGEAQGLLAFVRMLEERYAASSSEGASDADPKKKTTTNLSATQPVKRIAPVKRGSPAKKRVKKTALKKASARKGPVSGPRKARPPR